MYMARLRGLIKPPAAPNFLCFGTSARRSTRTGRRPGSGRPEQGAGLSTVYIEQALVILVSLVRFVSTIESKCLKKFFMYTNYFIFITYIQKMLKKTENSCKESHIRILIL